MSWSREQAGDIDHVPVLAHVRCDVREQPGAARSGERIVLQPRVLIGRGDPRVPNQTGATDWRLPCSRRHGKAVPKTSDSAAHLRRVSDRFVAHGPGACFDALVCRTLSRAYSRQFWLPEGATSLQGSDTGLLLEELAKAREVLWTPHVANAGVSSRAPSW
jgi:hypothetical protein